MNSFPKLLKLIREESGLTQEQLAHILKVSKVLITMIETGQKEVSKSFVIKLAEKLKVHPSSMMPFIFFDDKHGLEALSKVERSFLIFGEKLQKYLITVKAKRLQKYVR